MSGYRYNNEKINDDRILWAELIGGDKAALGQLFDLYVSELLSYGYRICRDTELAKDAIQDVFIDLWMYRSNLSKDVQVKYYLYRCLRNALLKQIDNAQVSAFGIQEADSLEDPDASPESQWLATESDTRRHSQIARVLENLSDREKEVISLKYYSDMKIRQIASLLNLKEQTVANTLQNALVKLRKHLVYLLVMLLSSY
ncbi:RNA polymerase sigma factor [Dyadobacter bucti]|uniref:RNA polymerase sigma factor n=1 Tax=Dyadobacter bucti TaxID=2572203 RepID=UPI00110807B8|nr:sigma-70 family RNA polymerase sigma factor [Dyadobacter bucti]